MTTRMPSLGVAIGLRQHLLGGGLLLPDVPRLDSGVGPEH